MMAGNKTPESCMRKITDDYGGDHTKLCDAVRGSITLTTEEQIAAVLGALLGGQMKGEGVTLTVLRSKNRFDEPLFTGIRDILLNILVEVEGHGAHVCEIQVSRFYQNSTATPSRAHVRASTCAGEHMCGAGEHLCGRSHVRASTCAGEHLCGRPRLL
jgi:hypothetical protein